MLDATRELLRDSYPVSALADCHCKGIDSFVFRNRISPESGMLRVFALRDDCDVLNTVFTANDYAYMPHNHRQDITLTRLCGDPCNILLVLADGAKLVTKPVTQAAYQIGGGKTTALVYRYRFGSAITNGEFSLLLEGPEHVVGHDVRPLAIGDKNGIFMLASEFHTMTASPLSAWCVEEGRLSGDLVTFCYSTQSNKQLSPAAGLYRSMSPDEIDDRWEEVLRRARKEGTL